MSMLKMGAIQLLEMMNKAASNKLHPHIKYKAPDGTELKFSLAARGRFAGSIRIYSPWAFSEGNMLGWIEPSGNHVFTRYANEAAKWAILEFIADPVGKAKISGQAYNYCCFCGLQLTNKSSVYHGYGPICAENYDLPWGDVPEADISDLGLI